MNSAQAIALHGLVRVELESRNGDTVLSVRDDGRGIAPEHLARVTEPFNSTRTGGTGLGLALAKRIMAAHGGRLEIQSGPGRGTTVRLVLQAHRA